MAITTLVGADINAWTLNNNDVTPEGPILEISAGVNAVNTAQFRGGTATQYLVRAVAGAECLGDISDPSAIATIDFQGLNLYFRKPNITFENVYVRWYDQKASSDDYSNLHFENCVIDAQHDLGNPCVGGATFTNCVLLLGSGNAEDSGLAQVVYYKGAVPGALLRCTVINVQAPANGSFGVIHTASSGDVSVNQTVSYSPNVQAFGNSGTGTVTGDYNAGHDSTMPGGNSISTVTTDVFEDYANGDYRLKAESAPALLTNPAGAFVQAVVNVDPTLDTPVPDVSIIQSQAASSIDLGSHFSDANVGDTLTFSLTPGPANLPSGITFDTATGVLAWDGSQVETVTADYVITATDGNGGSTPSDTFALVVTAIVPVLNNIDTDNDVFAGQTSVPVSTLGLPTIQPTGITLTLGGQAIILNNWNSGQFTVNIPLEINILGGTTTNQLLLNYTGLAGGAITIDNVTLSQNASRTQIALAVIPDEALTESYYEYAKTDTEVGSFTMVVGDVLVFENATGLTVDDRTLPSIDPPMTVTGGYKIWDTSAGTFTPLSTYTWTDDGIPVIVPVAPVITLQPVGQTLQEGDTDSVSFSAAASGVPSPTVQWQKDIRGSGVFTAIAGETNASITLAGTDVTLAANNGDQYRALFTNTEGIELTNEATLTVTPAAVLAPVLISNIPNQIGVTGDAVDLDISVHWSNSPTSFAVTSTQQLPAGVTLTAAGRLVGNLTTIESLSGIIITATNITDSTPSNVFSWNVTAAATIKTSVLSGIVDFDNNPVTMLFENYYVVEATTNIDALIKAGSVIPVIFSGENLQITNGAGQLSTITTAVGTVYTLVAYSAGAAVNGQAQYFRDVNVTFTEA